jgi:3-hydroxyisobutyrate dehydrogenase-like beta-hydroxyacid dehydrogenase
MSKPRMAILGLGIMGAGMASRLLSAGFPVAVYNRNPDKAGPFSNAGALVAGSPREAASHAEIIISMVADDLASQGVWLGENGALAGAARGSLLIECSTLTVGWIKELSAAAMQRGCEFLDAPVTGTKPHAASGELLFLVGGSASALATRNSSSGSHRKRRAAQADQQFHVRRTSGFICGSSVVDRGGRA